MMNDRGYGQVTVLPLCVPSPTRPHATMQSGPVQFVTVQADPGHVTWHWGLPAQSTRQLDVPLHST